MKQRISSQWLAGAAALVATAPVLAADGQVAGSVIPGMALVMVAFLSCLCLLY